MLHAKIEGKPSAIAPASQPPEDPIRLYRLKTVLSGDQGVGKSSLILQFVENAFQDTTPVRFEGRYMARTIEVGRKLAKLELVDTVCEEIFRHLSDYFYDLTKGIMLVYDVTNKESFNNIRFWFKDMEKYYERHKEPHPPILLVGNKCDLVSERVVDFNAGASLAQELGIPFIETSSKDHLSVDATFALLSEPMIQELSQIRNRFYYTTPEREALPVKKSCTLQ